MTNKERKLTSVRLDGNLYERFKDVCLETRFSFQKLATRAIYLYITDLEFRKKIHNQTDHKID